jgi:hypothetical protein
MATRRSPAVNAPASPPRPPQRQLEADPTHGSRMQRALCTTPILALPEATRA